MVSWTALFTPATVSRESSPKMCMWVVVVMVGWWWGRDGGEHLKKKEGNYHQMGHKKLQNASKHADRLYKVYHMTCTP